MRHVHLNRNEGFTLVEFCIALLIITVGLFGLLRAVTSSISMNLETQLRDEAVRLADDRMSQLKALPIETLPANDNWNVPVTVRQSTINYTVTQTISKPYNTQNTSNVQIDVAWTYKGSPHVHTLSSLISKLN